MRALCVLLMALLAAPGCRLLLDYTPCEIDENCVLAERCDVALSRCVPRVEPPREDAGAPAREDGGAPRPDGGAPSADGGVDAGPGPVDAGPGDFRRRQRFDLDTTQLLGDLSDFPVPLDLSGTDTQVGDFEVRTPGGTRLPVEVERADPLFVWVRLPTLSAGNTGAHVWVYFDHVTGGVTPPGGVWDNDYMAVFHCADDVTAVTAAADSSGKGNDGLLQGTWNADDRVPGQAGDAFELDGATQYLDLGNGAGVTPPGPFTVEAWYRVRSPGPGNSYLVSRGGFGGNRGFDLSFNDYGANDSWIEWRTYLDGTSGNGASEAQIALDQWQYAVGTFQGGEQPKLFLDGALAVTAANAWPSGASIFASTEPLAIGNRPDTTGEVPGAIDEVRLSTVRRSDAYIDATFHALTGDLVTTGVVETLP